MTDGKWISDLAPDTAVADAARHVLAVRLDVVRAYLPRALHDAAEDIEHVHQLRVGTRRAVAALDIFALCLPEKAYKTARKHLRRLRRAAGAARDWDVFLLELRTRQAQQQAREQPGLDLLCGYALAQRLAAQDHLQEIGDNEPFAFERLLAETLAAVHKPRPDTGRRVLLDLARPLLTDLLRQLHEATAGPLQDYDRLHRARILGKRLRYAMEVFGDCFAPPFRETLYPAVEEMQDILGRANDSHVAGQRLAALRDHLRQAWPVQWKRWRTGVEGLLRFHEQRLPAERQQFLAWWKRWQKSGTEAAFAALLTRAAVSGPVSLRDAGTGNGAATPPATDGMVKPTEETVRSVSPEAPAPAV